MPLTQWLVPLTGKLVPYPAEHCISREQGPRSGKRGVGAGGHIHLACMQ